jgi:hypothetical protein
MTKHLIANYTKNNQAATIKIVMALFRQSGTLSDIIAWKADDITGGIPLCNPSTMRLSYNKLSWVLMAPFYPGIPLSS